MGLPNFDPDYDALEEYLKDSQDLERLLKEDKIGQWPTLDENGNPIDKPS